MVDFEKIGDTFEEGFDKVKDFTKKNKVLTIAIVGVGAFALYKLFTSKYTSDETVSTYAYVPTGYDGYPTMSESVSYDDVVEQMRTETSDINEEFYNQTMSDVTQLFNNLFSEYVPIIETDTGYDDTLTTGSYIEEQRVKAQMQSNSEAWYSASADEKKRLEAENQTLGSLIGATFDSATGTWYKDGETLYNVSVKNKTNTSTANLTNVGVTDYTVNESQVIAQMKSNSEAWYSASDTEKKRLEAENQTLGASIGATYNSSTGTWTSSTGSSLYTVSNSSSKKTSSTSTNVKTTSSSSTKTSSSSSTDSVTSQMKANSEAWHSASASEKKRLESENQTLGASIGATYNSSTGTWTSANGTKLY